MEQTIEELHQKAESARENGLYVEALELLGQVILKAGLTINPVKCIDALLSRTLTYKHLYYQTESSIFAVLSVQDAKSALAIAEDTHIEVRLSRILFRLGNALMLQKLFDQAIGYYEQSIAKFHESEAELGDILTHLGEALYRNGKIAEGKEKLFEGLTKLQTHPNDVDSFTYRVWESGCHLRIAELLHQAEPGLSFKHLNIATKIIDSDERLIIRKQQLKILKKNICP